MVKICKGCRYVFPSKYKYCPFCAKELIILTEKEFKNMALKG